MANRSHKTSTSGQTQLNLGTMSSKDFKRLLDSQSLVDVTLACDGGQISAHKVVLSACSSYIHKILENHPVEHPIIILPELDIKDIRTLVNYMYTGELLTMNAPSHSLLKTAAVLNVNSLNDFFSESSTNSPSSSSSSPNLASLTTTTAAAAAINNHNNNGHNSSSTSSNTNTRNNVKNINNVTKQLHKYKSRMMINNTINKNNINNNTNNTLTTSSDSKNNMNNVNDNVNVKYLNINNLQEFLGANYNHLDDDDFDDLMDESSDLQPDDSMMMLPNDASDDLAKNQKATESLSYDADKEIRCHLCDIKLSDVKCLYRHVLTRHLPDRWGYRCEFCDREFSRDDHLMRHYTTKHKGMEFNREKIRETRRHNREMAKNFHDRHAT